MSHFRKGETVKMAPKAARMFPSAVQTGVVTSLLGEGSIRVRRTGLKGAETWHESFWRPAEGKEPAK